MQNGRELRRGRGVLSRAPAQAWPSKRMSSGAFERDRMRPIGCSKSSRGRRTSSTSLHARTGSERARRGVRVPELGSSSLRGRSDAMPSPSAWGRDRNVRGGSKERPPASGATLGKRGEGERGVGWGPDPEEASKVNPAASTTHKDPIAVSKHIQSFGERREGGRAQAGTSMPAPVQEEGHMVGTQLQGCLAHQTGACRVSMKSCRRVGADRLNPESKIGRRKS
jgi:hypothetical protein